MSASNSMTDAEIVFDPTAVEGIDQSTVQQVETSFPTIQWNGGNQKMKKAGGMDYAGGFFIPEDAVDADVLLANRWEKTTYSHGEKETVGFWRRELAISVIAMRKRWEVTSEGSRFPTLFPWDAYEQAKSYGRPSGRTHALILVKGLEELGPFILTLKGMVAMAFEGGRNSASVITAFAQTVIRKADMESDAAARKSGKQGGQRWPFRCFWLPVGAARDAKGEPVFTQVGQGANTINLVLPVALGLPEKAEGVQLGRFYVGADLLRKTNELFNEAQASGWLEAWKSFNNNANTATSAEASTSNGSNGNGATPAATATTVAAPDSELLSSLGL